ncbi:MAG TPA: single-stranded-DNA-specific exonuclease RecJ [Thermoanaerobaculia bacterium]|nr:single-stranded-DNA-specific exonuclease RecJ [Thermoanaerobaculia bacterium]
MAVKASLATAAEWVVAPLPQAAVALATAGFSPRLAALLARRGVADAEAAERFLHPTLDQLHAPALLAGMTEAVARLLEARRRGERVAIVGDYDVDGVSSTALLLASFTACGIAAEAILPHRLEEGYGFQPVHVERAQAQGARLIVTADCGSSSVAAAERAHSLGIDVVVTDHHLPGCALPSEVIQINPRQAGCTYPFPDLAAVGLALKLALALAAGCGRRLSSDSLLRVACLGTIADLVPLLGENRVIASLGLAALAGSRSEGLKALIRQSGMKPPFTAADVGYRLGPRINAAGRLHTPEQALELLMSRDPRRAADLALQLEGWNRQRQAEEARVVEEATAVLSARRPLPSILVAWSPGWHRGVVGVAAGRIARDLGRPTLLLGADSSLEDGGEMLTGSGRSIPGIELHSFLARWGSRMERFGGHAQAVGLTVARERAEELRREWEAAAAEWPAERFVRRLEVEVEVTPAEIGHDLLAELARLEPHGQGNPQPLLRTGPLRLDGVPRLFGNGHLAAHARGEDGAPVELVGWRWQARASAFGGRFEVVGFLEKDGYTGGPVIRLVDCRPLPPGEPGSGAIE